MCQFKIQFDRPPTDVKLICTASRAVDHHRQAAKPSIDPANQNVNSTAKPDAAFISEAVSDIQQQLTELQQRRGRALAEMQQLTVDLAIAVTEKMLFQKIDAGEFPFVSVIEQITNQLETAQPLTIAMNPQDKKVLEAQLDSLNDTRLTGSVIFRGDGHLPRGRVTFDCGQHEYFYDIAIQLAEIRQTIMENLHESEIERRTAKTSAGGLRRFPDRRSVG